MVPPDPAEALARMAAELRGVDLEPQADTESVEEPQTEEPEQAEDINVEALLVQRGKRGHAALVRTLHPDESG